MSVEEVVRIMGHPYQSSNQPLPSSSEYVLGYFYTSGSESLIAMFRERKLIQAKFNITDGFHVHTNDIIQADINDFSTSSNQQYTEQHSSSNSRVRSVNLKDAKNELLDKYLREEITKEEYFQLRRDLEKR